MRLIFPVIFTVLLCLLTGTAVAGLDGAEKAFLDKNYETAFKEWQPLAESGDPEAQLGLGWLYDSGKGVKQSYEKAAKWYAKAADQGHPRAQVNLAGLHYLGRIGPADFVKAEVLFHEATKKGDMIGEYMLGLLYFFGAGKTPQIFFLSAEALKRAAESGLAEAQYQYGAHYLRGYGTERNYNEAIKWFRLSADQKYPEAQTILSAMFGLNALVYGNKNEVSKDLNLSFEWNLKAAEQGDPSAIMGMAFDYLHGQSVKKDLVEALKWYILGERRSNDNYQHIRRDIEQNMTRKDKAEAKRRADAWKPTITPFKSLSCYEAEKITPGLCPLPINTPD